MAAVAFAAMCVLATVWVKEEFANFERESSAARDTYIAEQKKILSTITEEVVSFVEFNRSQTERRVRNAIRKRVEEAHSIATHILKNFSATHNKVELQAMVREALRPIRFNTGRGYFFAVNLDGVSQLVADRPEFEGRNNLDIRDLRGKYIVRDTIDVGREKGEGFYKYYWSKPGQPRDQHYEKISYVKLFEPWGWVIGTGEYLVDMEDDIKLEVLNRLSEMKMKVLSQEYVFAGQWDGMSLAGPAKGKNMIDVTDVNGFKIVQELIQTAKNGGGFVEYVIPKFGQERSARKISYVAGIPDWQWYVGIGSFVDDIEQQIARNEAQFRQRLFRNLAIALILVLSGALAVFISARMLSLRTRASFEAFLSFFEKERNDSGSIDADKLAFREFATIADAANQMVTRQTRDMREARDEADLANKAKSAFLANMSHELRTPLNAILGFSSSIQEKVFGPLDNHKYEEYVNIIHDSGEHLLELIDDILDLAKVEADAMNLDEETMNLVQVAEIVFLLLAPRAERGEITLVNKLGEDLPFLYADQLRMKQILLNLISNAVKFSEPGGEVILESRINDDKSLSLLISDSGIGMDDKEMKIAHAQFGQVEDTLARKQEGTGLGLPLTKQLVELHGGTMEISSRKGTGTQVVLHFPADRVIPKERL